jgi:hypothetical protein
MYTFRTRYRDMTFEGLPVRSTNYIIETEDEKVAGKLRKKRDIWEITGALDQMPAPPRGVRGIRMSEERETAHA